MHASLAEYTKTYKHKRPRKDERIEIKGFSFSQYTKITATCRLAKKRRLKYAWIDSCCIKKENQVELAESINHMAKWYQQASVHGEGREKAFSPTSREAHGGGVRHVYTWVEHRWMSP